MKNLLAICAVALILAAAGASADVQRTWTNNLYYEEPLPKKLFDFYPDEFTANDTVTIQFTGFRATPGVPIQFVYGISNCTELHNDAQSVVGVPVLDKLNRVKYTFDAENFDAPYSREGLYTVCARPDTNGWGEVIRRIHITRANETAVFGGHETCGEFLHHNEDKCGCYFKIQRPNEFHTNNPETLKWLNMPAGYGMRTGLMNERSAHGRMGCCSRLVGDDNVLQQDIIADQFFSTTEGSFLHHAWGTCSTSQMTYGNHPVV